ncbi:MAG: hypothetical protein J6125_03900, partial [Clostridia bacterium]|nr:hypothetical protein [Clostridia bacterium]
VLTTVDNRRLTPGAVVTADGARLSLRAADRRVRASRVVCPDFGAYLFDGVTDLVVRKRKGERHDYFELVLPHGKKPKDLSFTYLLLPGADDAKAAEITKNPPVTVIKNDPSVMAARHRDGTRAYAFFEPCACDGVTSDAPLALMLRPTREGTTVIVGDPTHRQRTVSFTLPGEHRLTVPADGVTLTVGDGRTTVTLDTNARLGVPYRFTLA